MMINKSQHGFTLIEVLAVIGILSVLAIVAVPSYLLIKRSVALSSAVDEIADTLLVAQNHAMTSQDGKNWGVYFDHDQNQYILCYDDCLPANFSTTYSLNNGVQILSNTDTIIFTRLSGATTGIKTFEVGLSPDRKKTIQVDTVGKISIL